MRRASIKVTSPVTIFPDGREICDLRSPEGRKEYQRRRNEMFDRQDGLCGLCGLPMSQNNCTFEHTDGRGSGGSKRDDRIWIPCGDMMIPYNMAAHMGCNRKKGSMSLGRYRAIKTYKEKSKN